MIRYNKIQLFFIKYFSILLIHLKKRKFTSLSNSALNLLKKKLGLIFENKQLKIYLTKRISRFKRLNESMSLESF